MTPMNSSSVGGNKPQPPLANGGGPSGSAAATAANANATAHAANAKSLPPPQQQPQQQPIPATDLNAGPPPDVNFGQLDGADQFGNMGMEFASLEGGDVLDNFDFDSFLNPDADNGFNFDNLAFEGIPDTGGIEGAN